jgi:hypothetical protein
MLKPILDGSVDGLVPDSSTLSGPSQAETPHSMMNESAWTGLYRTDFPSFMDGKKGRRRPFECSNTRPSVERVLVWANQKAGFMIGAQRAQSYLTLVADASGRPAPIRRIRQKAGQSQAKMVKPQLERRP